MRLSHDPIRVQALFDDPNLVSHGGLVPVMALAERAGLPELLEEHVRPGGECGVNAPLKVGCLAAGMTAGADSIDDMGLLRHGAMGALFGGVRARPRWARTCAPIPGEMSCSSRRRGGSCWPGSPGRRRCCPGPTWWPSSISTPRKSGSTATRSRARSSGTRRSRASPSWSAG